MSGSQEVHCHASTDLFPAERRQRIRFVVRWRRGSCEVWKCGWGRPKGAPRTIRHVHLSTRLSSQESERELNVHSPGNIAHLGLASVDPNHIFSFEPPTGRTDRYVFIWSPLMPHRRPVHEMGHAHELTFSCYKRFPFLNGGADVSVAGRGD